MSNHRKFIKRVRGKDFAEMLPDLRLVAYLKSFNGNICGYYIPKNRKLVTVKHWFNDTEKELFLENEPDILRIYDQRDAMRIRLSGNEITMLPLKPLKDEEKDLI